MSQARPRVLVLCTANSCRSQMAEGWLRHDFGDRLDVFSAGTFASFVHPSAIQVMQEAGVDISGQRSKPVVKVAGRPYDLVITVCDNARDACPVLPGARKLVHEPIEDPVGNPPDGADGLDDFRRARDEIRDKLGALVRKELSDTMDAKTPE